MATRRHPVGVVRLKPAFSGRRARFIAVDADGRGVATAGNRKAVLRQARRMLPAGAEVRVLRVPPGVPAPADLDGAP